MAMVVTKLLVDDKITACVKQMYPGCYSEHFESFEILCFE